MTIQDSIYNIEEFRMRNKDQHKQHCNYLDHLAMSERDHYFKVYGVNRTSIVNEVPLLM